jgi:hypothetical protein
MPFASTLVGTGQPINAQLTVLRVPGAAWAGPRPLWASATARLSQTAWARKVPKGTTLSTPSGPIGQMGRQGRLVPRAAMGAMGPEAR